LLDAGQASGHQGAGCGGHRRPLWCRERFHRGGGAAQLDAAKVPYEAWTAALYPFMDIPALVTAIVVASIYITRKTGKASEKVQIWPIIKESLQSSAVTALLLGVALGILT